MRRNLCGVLLLAATGRAENTPSPDSSGNLSPVSTGSGTTPTPDHASPSWTGTDGSYVSSVLSCQSLKDAWNNASTSWQRASHSSYSYSTYTEYETKWLGNYSGPISTLCDGVPRATGSAPLTTVPTNTILQSEAPPFPTPEPSCTYNYRGCELLVSSYRTAYTSASAAHHTAALQSLTPPSCWTDPRQCITPAGEDGCRLDAGGVQLIHWAHSKPASALCTTTNALSPTPSTNPTSPPSTVISGPHTFTSPTVYLSFSPLYALLPCATTYPTALLAIPPTATSHLSSIAFATTQPITATRALTWADLASPVPLSAYAAQMSCHANWGGVRPDGCSTVYADDYLPWLALPTDPALLTGLDPRFGNCSRVFWRKYVFDPPLALTPGNDLLPTTTMTTTSPSAAAVRQTATTTREHEPAVTATTLAPGVVASADPAKPQNVVIDGQTLGPGAVTVVAGSEPVVVGTAAVVVGGSTTIRFATSEGGDVPGVAWATATATAVGTGGEAGETGGAGGGGRVVAVGAGLWVGLGLLFFLL